MLDNTVNQPTKLRTKSWFEINDDERGTYDTNSQIKCKTSMIKSSLCNFSGAYIIVSGSITVVGEGGNDSARATDRNNKEAILKNCTPFINCITEINNTKKTTQKI